MNYLSNRYPFTLISNFFRMAIRTFDAAPASSGAQLKRNQSDSALNNIARKSSQERLKLKKKSAVSLFEPKTVEKRSSDFIDSNNSLPYSKTSSEHSFRGLVDRKKSSYNLTSEAPKSRSNFDKELKSKLKKLQTSFDSSATSSKEALRKESKPKLKRPYPWQNFNLDSISQAELSRSKRTAIASRSRCSSDQSMKTLSRNSLLSLTSSNHSIKTVKSICSTPLRKQRSKENLVIKSQMPLFKSILKKSYSFKSAQPNKEVTFNNIQAIYGPKTSYSLMRQGQTKVVQDSKKVNTNKNIKIDVSNSKSVKKVTLTDSGSEFENCLGRFEPLRQEHSFVHLYTGKRQKNFQ